MGTLISVTPISPLLSCIPLGWDARLPGTAVAATVALAVLNSVLLDPDKSSPARSAPNLSRTIFITPTHYSSA